ncbi:VOC family protein [Streptomyces polyrhachis]|uniref:VOC family protein n=1 Tax=Streptomyces polyrhachis TaxID=1282885 RepID=A0ABW2GD01_9ACTN
MSPKPNGTPIWVDATFSDIEGAKSFYGDLLGWTFEEGDPQFGGYTQALSDGKRVGALAPPMPGSEEMPPAWTLYLASDDVAATATAVTAAGGTTVLEPMEVGDYGSMIIATDPAGVPFGVWQPGTHQGFEKENAPGAVCWAEVATRDAAAADGFFPAVFDYEVRKVQDDAVDFHVWSTPGAEMPALGRFAMGEECPPEMPSGIGVYFGVADVDEAIGKVTKAGGRVDFGPKDSPFGRFAAVSDPWGTPFAIIDAETTEGEMPEMKEI